MNTPTRTAEHRAHAANGLAGLRLVSAALALAFILSPTLALAQPTPPPTPELASPTTSAPADPNTFTGPPGPGTPTTPATPATAPAGTTPNAAPFIDIKVGGESGGLPTAIKIILLLGAMSFIPAMLLAMTSFTRIVIVLSMVRMGMGTMQLPPNRVLVSLALFLTAFTMAPVFGRIWDTAFIPWEAGQLTDMAALDAALAPLRDFMAIHTRHEHIELFMSLAGDARPNGIADVPTLTLIPAFILSELETAFQMGALLFLPFLVIELVVGSVLMSMGMMMLPPSTIALPLKILVFVAVDGWALVVGSLAKSITGAS
jgi:flagellar biosynthetic protein FliP